MYLVKSVNYFRKNIHIYLYIYNVLYEYNECTLPCYELFIHFVLWYPVSSLFSFLSKKFSLLLPKSHLKVSHSAVGTYRTGSSMLYIDLPVLQTAGTGLRSMAKHLRMWHGGIACYLFRPSHSQWRHQHNESLKYKAPFCVMFSILILLVSSLVHIFPSNTFAAWFIC
jgi:hypothetical protein